ncbi:gephyrin-like molybdotransferase Glp [uncultured Sneathiella sp.]|jgi:molybdopterin molybdotransferase|uniref:molybdopterin molybdotransferase MoeA n=1 Tax=uncultured Sneathiella sp. TaxID=879315 RepID=UPI0030DD72DF|tara:strand:+ start:555 stop:1769 length:1215 start_codon:yes stop_codon:yes gene_type:complete
MISVEEARKNILKEIRAVGTEVISLQAAAGRVLAENVRSRRTQPPADLSAMDGFAVKAADLGTIPASLKIVGEVPAGGSYDNTVGTGEAVRIFTGAALPSGTDTIIIQEDTEFDAETVTVKEGAAKGTYVRPAGLDFSAGDIGIKAPTILTPRDIGLLAAMDIPWITVRRKPKIALLSTGDELVRPGEPLGPNQIISSNSLAIAALIEAAGGEALDLGIAQDNAESLREKVMNAKSADMLITLGGASVGDHDLIQPVLGKEGLSVDFWRIAMRPGKPLMFGNFAGIPMLGMPGNPVSSLICSFLFLIPAIDALNDLTPRTPPRQRAILTHALKENDQREDYMRAVITEETSGLPVIRLFDKQDSSMLSPLSLADCLVVRAPFAAALPEGSEVDIIPLSRRYPSI